MMADKAMIVAPTSHNFSPHLFVASQLPDMPQNRYVKGQMTDEEMNWRVKQLLCFRLHQLY